MKIMPASLLAGILLSGCNTAAPEPQPDPSSTAAGAASEPSAASAASQPSAVAATQPSAKAGEMLFRRCVACHTVNAGGSHGIGPNLHGVIGRSLASAQGFSYSNAMKAKGGVWDEAALDHFLEQPMMAIPGSRMVFSGVIEPSDRQSLYLYLQQNSD